MKSKSFLTNTSGAGSAASRLNLRVVATLAKSVGELRLSLNSPRSGDRGYAKYAFNTYSCIMRCVLKNDPLSAMA